MNNVEREFVLMAFRIGELDPRKFRRQVYDFSRGGLPARAMGDGVRGSGTRWPIDDDGNTQDAFDRKLRAIQRAHDESIIKAALLIATAYRAENDLLLIPQPAARELLPCVNAWKGCTNEHFNDGECPKCRQHRSRHHMEWPNKSQTETLHNGGKTQ